METFGAQQRSAPLEPERRITLTSLVSDYLSNKHALCKNPMTTCPEFDLFLPHRCPDKRSKRAAPLNICARMMRRSVFPRHGGLDGAKLDRKLLYSRFRPVKSFRAGGEDRENNVCFTCTAFSGDGQFLLAGTGMGDLKMFNIQSGTTPATIWRKIFIFVTPKASRGAPGEASVL
jgi:HIV-1 Vpr-binding protein